MDGLGHGAQLGAPASVADTAFPLGSEEWKQEQDKGRVESDSTINSVAQDGRETTGLEVSSGEIAFLEVDQPREEEQSSAAASILARDGGGSASERHCGV